MTVRYGVVQHNGRATVWVRCPYALRELAKSVKGYRWDPDAKVWAWDVSLRRLRFVLDDIRALFPGAEFSEDDPWAASSVPEAATQPLEGAARASLSALPPLGRRRALYAHQYRVPAAALLRRRFLVLDEMGTGKTQASIEAACMLMQQGRVKRAVVICPLSVRDNWRRELDECAWWGRDDGDRLDLAVVRNNPPAWTGERIRGMGDREHRLHQLRRFATWTLMHYEAARLHPRELAALADGQLLILDEVHRLKNPRSKIAQVIAAVRPEYLIGLTGTLVMNRPEDAWLPLRLVAPELAGSKRSFSVRYLIERELQTSDGRRFRKVVGYKRLDELHQRIMQVSLRVTKAECLDLPPKTHVTRLCPPSPAQAEAYLQMLDEAQVLLQHDDRWFEVNAASVAAQVVRLQQIAAGFASPAPDRFVWFDDAGKLSELEAVLEEADKVVLWTRFRPVVKWLAAHFGQQAVAVFGDVRPERRSELERRFREDADCRLFIGQVQTVSEGINLPEANVVVFWDHWWSPGRLRQAVDRCHRIGQKRPVTVVHLLTEGTVDEYIYAQLVAKAAWADTVHDGRPQEEESGLRWDKKAFRRALEYRPDRPKRRR